MTNTPNSLSPQNVPNNSARCLGSGSYEDGKWHWREGCDDCQRRYGWAGDGWAGDWIEPPPIIAFECEYRIGPDEIVAQVSTMTQPTDTKILEFLLNQFQMHSPKMNGQHSWRFMNDHLMGTVGRSAKDAVIACMREQAKRNTGGNQ